MADCLGHSTTRAQHVPGRSEGAARQYFSGESHSHVVAATAFGAFSEDIYSVFNQECIPCKLYSLQITTVKRTNIGIPILGDLTEPLTHETVQFVAL